MRRTFVGTVLIAGTLLIGCGSADSVTDPDASDAHAVDASPDAIVFPTSLADTGLYSSIVAQTIADGVREFAPRWELFSDDAVKRRWIYLPPNTTIDASDMDFWSFPQGTKLWKEFARDGTVIETRMLWKFGPDDDLASWHMVSFQWNDDHSDAIAVPEGVVDAGQNDIPGTGDCHQCHEPERNPSVVLGFSALQLDVDASNGRWDLSDLVADGRLSPPPTNGQGAFFPLPSGGTTETAFGYLHANCGGCHNARSSIGVSFTPMRLRLSTDANARTSWSETETWTTTVNVLASRGGGTIVVGDDPDNSTLYQRINTDRPLSRMPPLGRETIDSVGVAAIAAWIESL